MPHEHVVESNGTPEVVVTGTEFRTVMQGEECATFDWGDHVRRGSKRSSSPKISSVSHGTRPNRGDKADQQRRDLNAMDPLDRSTRLLAQYDDDFLKKLLLDQSDLKECLKTTLREWTKERVSYRA